jgi:hypothetical protein
MDDVVRPVDPPDEHAEPGPPEVEAVPVAGTGIFRAELDSVTGATTYVELSEDEVADAAVERSALATTRTTRAAAADAARSADLSVVQAAAVKDPAFAALARVAGLIGPDEGVKL